MSFRLATALLAAQALACATAHNYVDPAGPRYAGQFAGGVFERGEIGLATFNTHYAQQVDRTIELFRRAEPLRAADIISLQEMDEDGVRKIAAALSLDYVYYPAILHPAVGRDFGNALLSRWPIQDDRKILLPHPGRTRKAQRIAVAGTILVGGLPIRVYSVHLGTLVEITPAKRRDQVAAILADADRFERVVVIGDLNSWAAGAIFEEHGFLWLTRSEGRTFGLFAWDHIFLRGLRPRPEGATGVVRNNLGASDHKPVWAEITLD